MGTRLIDSAKNKLEGKQGIKFFRKMGCPDLLSDTYAMQVPSTHGKDVLPTNTRRLSVSM